MVNPGLLKLGGVVLAVLIVGATGVVVYQDRQSQADYQAWARAENQKVFDASTKAHGAAASDAGQTAQ